MAAILCGALALASGAAGSTFYVAPGGGSTAGCPPLDPCGSIGFALSQASAPGDVVELAAGTYPQSAAIVVGGSDGAPIELRGAGVATVIDASGLDYGISITASHVALRALTIRGASVHNLHISGSNVLAAALVVHGGGAGIVLQDAASATLDHLLLTGSARPLQLRGTSNTVRINHATVVDGSGVPALLIDANSATVSVQNSIFAFNTAGDLAPTFAGVHRYNLRHGNGSSAAAGPGEITGDPLFADRARGDYHVRSSAGRWDPGSSSWVVDTSDSPAIDAADPLAPFALETAPAGDAAELGFYGNTSGASRTQIARIDVFDTPACQPDNAFFPDLPVGTVPIYGFYLEPTTSVGANLLEVVLPIALTGLTAGEISASLQSGISTIGPVAASSTELRFAIPQPHPANYRQSFVVSAAFAAIDPGDRLTIGGVQLVLDDLGPNVQYHTTPLSHEYPAGSVPQRVTCFSAGDVAPTSWWEQPDPATAIDFEDTSGTTLGDGDPLSGGRTFALALSDGGASSLFLRLDFGSGLSQSAQIKLHLDTNQVESVAGELCNNATPSRADTIQSIILYNYQGSTGSIDVGSRQSLSKAAGDFSVSELPSVPLAANRNCDARRIALDLSRLRQLAPASGPWSVRLIVDINGLLDTATQPLTKGIVNHVAEVSYAAATPPACTPRDAGWFDAQRPDTARADAAIADRAPDGSGRDLVGVDLAAPDLGPAADQGSPVIARAGPDQVVAVPADVGLDGSASRAPAGASFTWTQKVAPDGVADAPVATGAQATVHVDRAGLWIFELRVESDGLASTDLVQIEARAETADGCDCRQLARPAGGLLLVLGGVLALARRARR